MSEVGYGRRRVSWVQTIVGGGIGGAVVGGTFQVLNRWLDRRQSAAMRLHESDARVLLRLREAIPEQEIRFLREHDFGGSWSYDATEHVTDYYEQARSKSPDVVLSSANLESLRPILVAMIGAWYGSMALKSAPHPRLHGRQAVIPDEVHDACEWQNNRQELNETATAVANAYDALMKAARRTLPEAFAVGAVGGEA